MMYVILILVGLVAGLLSGLVGYAGGIDRKIKLLEMERADTFGTIPDYAEGCVQDLFSV